MILQLQSVVGSDVGNVVVKQMPMPVSIKNIPVTIEYEHNTNHLSTTLYIGDESYVGFNQLSINLDPNYAGRHVWVEVLLKNAAGVIVKRYRSPIYVNAYVVLGAKPVRPDVDTYIKSLEAEIQLLKEQGDVI